MRSFLFEILHSATYSKIKARSVVTVELISLVQPSGIPTFVMLRAYEPTVAVTVPRLVEVQRLVVHEQAVVASCGVRGILRRKNEVSRNGDVGDARRRRHVPRFGNQALSAVRVAEEPQRGDDEEDVGVEPRGSEEGGR